MKSLIALGSSFTALLLAVVYFFARSKQSKKKDYNRTLGKAGHGLKQAWLYVTSIGTDRKRPNPKNPSPAARRRRIARPLNGVAASA